MKYKYTKKSLLNIDYYDEIYKDEKLKKKLFKRYSKKYSIKKYIKRMSYEGNIIKKHTIFIDLKEHSFKMSNNVFGVLNLYSYNTSILKAAPSFDKIFDFSKKDVLKRKPKRQIILNHIVHGVDAKTNTTFSLGTNYKQYTKKEDFFADYEAFFREYTLNRGYHFQIRTIEVQILYSYYDTTKNKIKNK